MNCVRHGVPRAEYPDLLIAGGYRLGAEIGVEYGANAELILSRWPGTLILVDLWHRQEGGVYCDAGGNWTEADHENNYRLTVERLERFADRYRIVRALSVEAAQDFPDGSLDFFYLDANHSYPTARADLAAWYPKVRPGGLVSGHDFVDAGPPFGVRSAVLEFTRDLPVDLFVAAMEPFPNWYFFKP